MRGSVNNSDASTDTAATGDTWTLVDITIAHDGVEMLTDVLWGMGVVAIEERVHDDADLVTLRTSFGNDPTGPLEALIGSVPGVDVTVVHIDRRVADTWREFAETTWVTDTVAIVPSWVEPPSTGEHILIEPLDTFGLGNHPTTVAALRLCLDHVVAGDTVYDFGTGSGVLAVALAKLRRARVLVHDIAPGSPRAVATNVALNHVEGVLWSNGHPQESVDVVVANILAPVLIEEAEAICALASGGTVVLSGMREEQLETVLSAYRGARVIDTHRIDGWIAVAIRSVN